MAAPLVVLGGTSAPCPPLQLDGTGPIRVLGDAVLDDSCGSSSIGGDPSRLRPTGIASAVPAGLDDPFASLAAPSVSCAGSANPTPIGNSPSPTADVVYPLPVVISGITHFQAGRHVFCAGITFDSSAVVDGTDITMVVTGGSLSVDNGARLQLGAPTTGTYTGVLWWLLGTPPSTLHFGSAGIDVARCGVRADVADDHHLRRGRVDRRHRRRLDHR